MERRQEPDWWANSSHKRRHPWGQQRRHNSWKGSIKDVTCVPRSERKREGAVACRKTPQCAGMQTPNPTDKIAIRACKSDSVNVWPTAQWRWPQDWLFLSLIALSITIKKSSIITIASRYNTVLMLLGTCAFKKTKWGWGMLAWHTQSPQFIPQNNINPWCECTPGIPALRRVRQKDQ